MARLVFAPSFLKCLTLPKDEARKCIYEADLSWYRVFMGLSVTAILERYECTAPLILMIPAHDMVSVTFGKCRDTEGAIWELQELLEDMPGVWYVRSYNKGKTVTVEAVSFYELWR